MKVLIYLNTKRKISFNGNGGIESLNFFLYRFLKTSDNSIKILTKYPKKNKIKKKFDIIISSNDAKIFNYFESRYNFLWLHNFLQIEKSIRKGQFVSILKNKISCIFVSEFLKKRTSSLYNFSKKYVISNFLTFDFNDIKEKIIPRKNNIIWSNHRENELNKVIKIWITKFYLKNTNFNLLIYGNVKNNFSLKDINYYKKFNIFFYGNVDKKVLKKKYNKSLAMLCLAKDETFCLNCIEALSCGLPVFCYSNTVFDEIISNNFNGFKMKDINELYPSLIKISKMKNKKLFKIQKNCYESVKKFKFELVMQKWQNLLDGLKKNN